MPEPDLKDVISASRRTDIPAFYMDWLLAAIERGRVEVTNPFNAKQVRSVDLTPDRVGWIVLWSKDFGPFLDKLDDGRVRGLLAPYELFFLFTVNDAPRLEPRVKSLDARLDQAARLVDRFGAERLHWRFDPIVFWREADLLLDNTASFEAIIRRMAGLGVTACHTSFVHWYRKARRRFERAGLVQEDPADEEKRARIAEIATIAGAHGIKLCVCCNGFLDGIAGIEPSSCVDGDRLNRLTARFEVSTLRDAGQRAECGCTRSIDIGSYRQQRCLHECLYCYANPEK